MCLPIEDEIPNNDTTANQVKLGYNMKRRFLNGNIEEKDQFWVIFI